MTAIYNIGAGRILPHIPQDVSENLYDMMQQCFKRDPRLRPSAQDLLNHPFIKKDRTTSSTNGGLVEQDELIGTCKGIRNNENNFVMSQLIEASSEETFLSPVDSINGYSDIETNSMTTPSYPTSFTPLENNSTRTLSLATNNLMTRSLTTTEDFVNLEVDDVKGLHIPTRSAKGKVSTLSKLVNVLLKCKEKTQQLLKLLLL